MKNKILIFIVYFLFFGYVYGEDFSLSKVENSEYVPWEVIVKYNNASSSSKVNLKSAIKNSSFDVELKLNNLEIKDSLDSIENISLVEIKDDKTVEETVNLLKKDPNVVYAEPNYLRYFFSNNADTRKDEQWWLDYINWTDAYNQYSWFLNDSTWVVVWVIDNWINYNHPDLYYSMWSPENWKCKMKIDSEVIDVDCIHWYDFLHSSSTPLPNLSSHWTHVAGIIAATINNWKWIVWVNPHAKIAALKVWNGRSLTTYAEIQAIDFAIRNWIKIINASYWAYGSGDAEADALKQYMDFWWLFITAAWNDYKKDIDNDPEYETFPCMYDFDNIICVASIDKNWDLSSFSNYWKYSVDIAAPWTAILSTSIEDSGISTMIYESDFENDDWNWSWWNFFNWWDDTYAYGFMWELKSPSFNVAWKDFVYMGFSLTCASHGVDVELQYSTWFEYSTVGVIPWVYNMWYYYTIPVESKYHESDFSFRLKIGDGNTFCVVDDFSIYQDPYYESDAERYTYMDWTSMATPHVAWLASLVWAMNPSLTYSDIKNLIMDNWKDNSKLKDLIVSWKIIDIKNTLDAVKRKDIQSVSWLYSSRTGIIWWSPLEGISEYYFEVLSWDVVVKSWYIDETNVETGLTWNYMWRIQWVDEFWNKSDFSTGYICDKPVLNDFYLSWYECNILTWNVVYKDNCSDNYQFVWLYDNQSTWNESILNNSWILRKEFYIANLLWEESNHINVSYEWKDSIPTINKTGYKYSEIFKSSSQIDVWNIVSIFWVKDWECWENSISVKSVVCKKWKVYLDWRNLIITAESNQQWTSECNIVFEDDEWNEEVWIFSYDYDTASQNTNWWWGWWWGWWGGWWGGWSSVITANPLVKTWFLNDLLWSSGNKINTWGVEISLTWKHDGLVMKKDRILELFDEEGVLQNEVDFSWFNNSNPLILLSNWYSVEFNNAYQFAYRVWITTKDSIEQADMNWKLTRIAMAKMLSNYAMNVLGKKPVNIVVPNFPDVSSQLNDDYWWAVTLAYQLWIMWKWIKYFRPNDEVTRAEFSTALSRMLFWIEDWIDKYYSTHISKLYEEWIINNKNPDLKELRWYVMIMLMRSAKK